MTENNSGFNFGNFTNKNNDSKQNQPNTEVNEVSIIKANPYLENPPSPTLQEIMRLLDCKEITFESILKFLKKENIDIDELSNQLIEIKQKLEFNDLENLENSKKIKNLQFLIFVVDWIIKNQEIPLDNNLANNSPSAKDFFTWQTSKIEEEKKTSENKTLEEKLDLGRLEILNRILAILSGIKGFNLTLEESNSLILELNNIQKDVSNKLENDNLFKQYYVIINFIIAEQYQNQENDTIIEEVARIYNHLFSINKNQEKDLTQTPFLLKITLDIIRTFNTVKKISNKEVTEIIQDIVNLIKTKNNKNSMDELLKKKYQLALLYNKFIQTLKSIYEPIDAFEKRKTETIPSLINNQKTYIQNLESTIRHILEPTALKTLLDNFLVKLENRNSLPGNLLITSDNNPDHDKILKNKKTYEKILKLIENVYKLLEKLEKLETFNTKLIKKKEANLKEKRENNSAKNLNDFVNLLIEYQDIYFYTYYIQQEGDSIISLIDNILVEIDYLLTPTNEISTSNSRTSKSPFQHIFNPDFDHKIINDLISDLIFIIIKTSSVKEFITNYFKEITENEGSFFKKNIEIKKEKDKFYKENPFLVPFLESTRLPFELLNKIKEEIEECLNEITIELIDKNISNKDRDLIIKELKNMNKIFLTKLSNNTQIHNNEVNLVDYTLTQITILNELNNYIRQLEMQIQLAELKARESNDESISSNPKRILIQMYNKVVNIINIDLKKWNNFGK